jgi:Spy/CpxP family protein refolding chaperone
MKASSIVRYVLIAALAGTFSLPVVARAQDGSGTEPKPAEAKPEEKKDEKKADEKKTDEQPRRDRGGRGGDNGGGRGGRNGGGRGGMMNADQLKEELGLTEEQVGKVQGVMDEMREKFRSMGRPGQGGDMNDFREKMTEMQKESREKIKGFLTDAQKPKFEEYVKKQDERMAQFGRGGGQGGGGRGPFGNPEQRKKQLIEDAEKALVLSGEEKTVITPLVEKAVDARMTTRTEGDKRREEFLAFVKKDSPAEEVKAKLEAFRKARDEDNAKVTAAQKALRDVLTPEQEAKLVALGVLD